MAHSVHKESFIKRFGRSGGWKMAREEDRSSSDCTVRQLPPSICQMLVRKKFPKLDEQLRWMWLRKNPCTAVPPGMPIENIH